MTDSDIRADLLRLEGAVRGMLTAASDAQARSNQELREEIKASESRNASRFTEIHQRLVTVENADQRRKSEAQVTLKSTGDAMIARFNDVVDAINSERNEEKQILHQILEFQREARARAEVRSQLQLEDERRKAEAIQERERARAVAREEERLEREALLQKLNVMAKAVAVATPVLSAVGAAAAWLLTH